MRNRLRGMYLQIYKIAYCEGQDITMRDEDADTHVMKASVLFKYLPQGNMIVFEKRAQGESFESIASAFPIWIRDAKHAKEYYNDAITLLRRLAVGVQSYGVFEGHMGLQTRNRLILAGYDTVEKLLQASVQDMFKTVRNFGRQGLERVLSAASAAGFNEWVERIRAELDELDREVAAEREARRVELEKRRVSKAEIIPVEQYTTEAAVVDKDQIIKGLVSMSKTLARINPRVDRLRSAIRDGWLAGLADDYDLESPPFKELCNLVYRLSQVDFFSRLGAELDYASMVEGAELPQYEKEGQ